MLATEHTESAVKNNDLIISLNEISKSFPGVKVLKGVNMDVRKGEVHALMGENGAGKSTLMKIISGIHSSEGGTIYYKGKEVSINNPLDAKQMGISLIHQEISIVPELTVAENIFLGSIPKTKYFTIDWSTLRKKSRDVLDRLKCDIKENELVGNLTIARQQMVEIARSLAANPDLVIFDEPTASLTDNEKVILFDTIRMLKSQDVGIIYISHRMDEVFEITDRITVLRDGVKTGTFETSKTNPSEITNLMIGRDISHQYEKATVAPGDDILRVEELSIDGLFKDVSFKVRVGEVVGLYGLIGAGRSEVAETVFGIRKQTKGKIFIENDEQQIKSSKKAVELGIGFVPEDRKKQGLFLNLGCKDNLSISKINKYQKAGFIIKKTESELFEKYRKVLAIKTSNPDNLVVNLSGGNQQKIIIARWMAMNPRLLILDEPTRGIDVGSKSEIHKLVRQMANEGVGVLVISSEMPEIIGLCDRIYTMSQGKITDEFSSDIVTESHLINGAMESAG